MPKPAHPHYDKTAIIDIGSNSVRLVVYEGLGKVPLPVVNEKAQCGLAYHLAQSGRLNPEGVEKAFRALARYKALIRIMKVEQCIAIATAAVRDAADGETFIRRLKKELGLDVTIISGKEEAELAGLGVLSSIHNIHGAACDLGGGSLELVALDGEKRRVGSRQSWPLGVLSVMDRSAEQIEPAKNIVAQELKSCHPDILSALKGNQLYAIGGSLRALAKVYMEQTGYPIRMLHHYTVAAEPFREFCGRIAEITDTGTSAFPGVPRKRAESLPYAATVLRRLIKIGQPAELVFSLYGIREGLLYKLLIRNRQAHDPLQVVAKELTIAHGGDVAFGKQLYDWITPAFEIAGPRWEELRRAVCHLVTIPLYELSAERSELAFYSVLQAPLLSVTHAERFLLSLAVMYRYQHSAQIPLQHWEQFDTLPREHQKARLLGLLINLAYTLSGGMGDILQHIRLTAENGSLHIVSDIAELCEGEMVQKRLYRARQVYSALILNSMAA